jgi:hypothetical protein
MDDVAVDAHHAEPGSHCDGLVGHHPDAAGVAVHLHRKRRRRVQGAVAGVLQGPGDPMRGLVDDLPAAVELLIGRAASGGAHVVAVHPHHQRDVAPGPGQRGLDVLTLGGQFGIVDGGERDVIGAGRQTQLPQPLGVDDTRRFPAPPGADGLHRGMVGDAS